MTTQPLIRDVAAYQPCRCCGKLRRPKNTRGLCWVCFYTPGVREKFPPTSPHGRRGVRDFNGRTALAARPTSAPPGTPEKVAVLEERARLGLSLWHPLDARIDD